MNLIRTPQQSEICVKFTPILREMLVNVSASDTQTLENVARGKLHTKFHDTFGREKHGRISLRASAG